MKIILIVIILKTTLKADDTEEYNSNSNTTFEDPRLYQFANLTVDYFKSRYNFDNQSIKSNVAALKTFSFDDKLFSSYKWYNDSEAFGNMLNTLSSVLASTIENPKSNNTEYIWNVTIYSIEVICKRLQYPPANMTFPWGNNWYQFSITFPRILVLATYLYLYEFKKMHPKLIDRVKQVIPQYIKNPMKSLGWVRNGPNSVMIAVPYIGAHLILGDLDETLKTPEVIYTVDFVRLEPVTSGEGLYHDGGFVFHKNVRAYGYIYDPYEDFILLANFFGLNETLGQLAYLKMDLENPNPNIKVHFEPWFGRHSSLKTSYYNAGSYGFNIHTSCQMVSIRQPLYTLQFNGQSTRLAYYEADRLNNKWAQYWAMSRQYYYADTDQTMRRELVPYYPGIITIGNKQITINSTTSTTETFAPMKAKCLIAKIGDTAIGMYNEWTIDKLSLNVTELILVSEYGYTVAYKVYNLNKTDNEEIFVTINLGKANNNNTYNIFRFINDASIVHSGNQISMKKVVRENDGFEFDCLQCVFNSHKEAAFTTFHGTAPPDIFDVSTDFISTSKYVLKYIDDLLWLYDLEANTVAVAQFDNLPMDILQFESEKIQNELGDEVQMIDGQYDENSGQYIEEYINMYILKQSNSIVQYNNFVNEIMDKSNMKMKDIDLMKSTNN